MIMINILTIWDKTVWLLWKFYSMYGYKENYTMGSTVLNQTSPEPGTCYPPSYSFC